MQRRVVVTGLGVVSPHGNRPPAVFDALCAGRSAVAWDDELATVTARSRLDTDGTAPRARQSGVDRVSQLAIAAGLDALGDAGWTADAAPWSADRAGIYAGTGFGGTSTVSEAVRRFHADERIPPLSVVGAMANAAAAQLAIRSGFHGPALTFSVACASSSVAISSGAKDIAAGEIDVALVGGAEAPLVPSMVASWKAMHTLAERHVDDAAASSRPFSRSRTGLVLAEGSAFLVLEEFEHARRRGARIYAELAGSGTTCDAAHLTKPQVDGQVRAMRAALARSGLAPDEIGYYNAHGTATLVGDEVEAESIRTVWGDALPSLRVSSTKSMHGHLLGAAGALEALVTTLAIHTGRVPPNAHCDDRDAACALPLIGVGAAQPVALQAAMSNSFAFGGTNSSLVFRRVDGCHPSGSSRR